MGSEMCIRDSSTSGILLGYLEIARGSFNKDMPLEWAFETVCPRNLCTRLLLKILVDYSDPLEWFLGLVPGGLH